ncbi:MAG: zinc-dependent metalloprotease family protein [Chitinophagales bacterium]
MKTQLYYFEIILLFFTLFLFQKNAKATTFLGKSIPHYAQHQKLCETFQQISVFEIDSRAMKRFLEEKKETHDFSVHLENSFHWTMKLQPNNILTKTCKAFDVQKKQINIAEIAYKGHLQKAKKNGQKSEIRLSIDENFVSGFIENEQERIYIQPLNDFLASASKDEYIVYHAHDLTTKKDAICGFENEKQTIKNDKNKDFYRPFSDENCIETLHLALASDLALSVEKNGFDKVIKLQMSVINAMQPAFEAVGVHLLISEFASLECVQCESENTMNPYNALDEFLAWGNNSGFANDFDIAQLWSNKEFVGSPIGLAKFASLCSNQKYSIIQDFSNGFERMRALSAHEIGHSLGASHDVYNSSFLMQPNIVGNITEFSEASTQAIQFLLSSSSCVNECNRCLLINELYINKSNYPESVTLTWSGETPTYQVRIKRSDSDFWLIDETFTNSFYVFSNIDACYAYDVQVLGKCDANTAVETLSLPNEQQLEAAKISNIDIDRIDETTAEITWQNTNISESVYLNVKKMTDNTTIASEIITGSNYVLSGLLPCLNYEITLSTTCQNGLFVSPQIFNLPALPVNSLYGEILSATSAKAVFFSNYSSQIYRMKMREIGNTNFETPFEVESGIFYPLNDLDACTSYELVLEMSCGNENFQTVKTSTFTTNALRIQKLETMNCDSENQAYDLNVTVQHNYLENVSAGFQILINNMAYDFEYTASPQTILIENLPANGDENILVSLQDLTFSACNNTKTYTAFRPVCECRTIFFEDFEACQWPAIWTTQAIGTNENASWQVGKTSDNFSLNGSCMLYFDDDDFDDDGGERVQVSSPKIDLSYYEQVTLSFDYNFNTIGGKFRIEGWNGTNWQAITNLTQSLCGFWGCNYPTLSLDISHLINSDFQLRFVYDDFGLWDWYVGIDNIELCGYETQASCSPNFVYHDDLFCTTDDNPQPTITGQGNGFFTAFPNGLSLNATNGLIDLSNSLAGDYAITYHLNDFGNCFATQNISISPYCETIFEIKAILQAAYSPISQKMTTYLVENNLLPLKQPYSQAPFFYDGKETFGTADNIPQDAVDWVLIELRSITQNIAVRKAGVLLSDGRIIDAISHTETPYLSFKNIAPNQLYMLTIRHRNHLAVASSSAFWIGENDFITHDFTQSISQAFGTKQQVANSNNKAMFWAGDVNNDGIISYADFNVYKIAISSVNAYLAADINLDGAVNAIDAELWQQNAGIIGVKEIR